MYIEEPVKWSRPDAKGVLKSKDGSFTIRPVKGGFSAYRYGRVMVRGTTLKKAKAACRLWVRLSSTYELES